jgi:cytochrome P450 family 33
MTLLLPIAFFVFFLVHQFWWRRRGLPNGPLPLPIIGNLYQFMFARRWEEKFVEFKERYGPIYTLFLGSYLIVFFWK